MRQQPDVTMAEEVKSLRGDLKRKSDIVYGLMAEKNMYTSELATMRATQEVKLKGFDAVQSTYQIYHKYSV